jgi:hypothetical protein
VLLVRPTIPEGYQERLLLAAILRRACYDIALYKGARDMRRRRMWIGAYRWMFDDTEPQHLHPLDRFTSFLNVCTILDQDPESVRRKTLKLTRSDVKKFEMVDPYGRIY